MYSTQALFHEYFVAIWSRDEYGWGVFSESQPLMKLICVRLDVNIDTWGL